MSEAAVEIPGFRIRRELGRGAMGVVYLAHEEALQRDVALKVLKGAYGHGTDHRARFQREVRASARLGHPNIVPILTAGEAQGRLWYAMEFVAGDTLEAVLAAAPGTRLRAARGVRIAREVALALHSAHAAGVTHRDVKPGNVILVPTAAPTAERSGTSRRLRRSWSRRPDDRRAPPYVDRPLLTDFGLAADSTASKLSESGMLIGTPGYMAPEQFRGSAADVGPHSDQWALGVLLYECITGRMPFPTNDLPTLARMVSQEDPIAPSRLDPRIDRDLETIVLKALQKNPRDRYADCAVLADDLGRWLREEPITARPPGPLRRVIAWGRRRPARATALAGLLLAGLIAAGVWIGLGVATARRIAGLEREAQEALAAERYDDAERFYEEWIALDPGAPGPRDGRARVRARRGVAAALELYGTAEAAMRRLAADRERLTALEAQARRGQSAPGGTGLGAEDARGSEPWWMREPAYRAGRELERLRRDLARRWAEVGSSLAIARSLVDANAEAAGSRGRDAQRTIYAGAAAWHAAEWRHAVTLGDEERAALHRFAIEELDPAPHRAELSGVREVVLEPTDPPSEAWLFRYEREAHVTPRGGPRLLPLPYDPERGLGALPAVYAEAARARLGGEGRRPVEADVPGLSRPLRSTETHIETLGGRMHRDRYEARLTASAYPLLRTETGALGRVEVPRRLSLPPGRYLLLLQPEGLEPLRLPFEVGRTQVAPLGVPAPLALVHAPPGFVPVTAGTVRAGADRENLERAAVGSFLAARFEVTYADYWAFLNDPRTLAEIEAHRGEGLRFVPRSEGVFERPEDGALPYRPPNAVRYHPMDNPEHPVAHLNLFDLVGYLTPPEGEDEPRDDQYAALAAALRASETVGWGYLRWRTERSRERARDAVPTGAPQPDVAFVRTSGGAIEARALRFTLPTESEWARMARGGDRRTFVYGDEREWTYFKGVRSRRQNPAPEAVGLFPHDESVFGVRDLTGSVAEWTADWKESGAVFWVKGHAWGSQTPDDDRIDARNALAPGRVSSTVGVRLVVRVLEPAAAR